MKSLPLGQTGEKVSAICTGILYYGSRLNKAQSFHLLDRYVDAAPRSTGNSGNGGE